jgi:tetratricopeptide (TPR) repeat protein
MRSFLFVLVALFCFKTFAQNDALARQYFENGAFDKAVGFYEKLYKQNPERSDFLQNLIVCYQQLEKYDQVEELLLPFLDKRFYSPNLLIELGYNYSLKGQKELATDYYEKALAQVEYNPGYAFMIGDGFKKKSLLQYALRTYEKSVILNPNTNIKLEIARIYGELGDIEKMFINYLELIQANNGYKRTIMNRISQFLEDNPLSENNRKLKKVLLKKMQGEPDILWNETLSWLYAQQRQYKNAFIQEKAILKRSGETSLDRIMDLATLAKEDENYPVAKTIFSYIIEKSNDRTLQLNAYLFKLEIDTQLASEKEYKTINQEFESLLNNYGIVTETIPLQIAYARFLAFQYNRIDEGIAILKESLELPVNRYELAKIKINLGDILVYDEKFNQALIYYAQVQKSLKNDVIGQNARFKVAKTSFYKGDFDWALTQLKVLRSSTTQLIANDAMQLSLLISDNSLKDSTQTALKIYAKADLLAYQNKNKQAIELLSKILDQHKGERIEDEALLKQAKLFENQKEYDKARYNYIKIIEFYNNDILVDDALFGLAELYRKQFAQPEKAKEFYEKIIFNHPNSIYFVKSRKTFRQLRGDAIN